MSESPTGRAGGSNEVESPFDVGELFFSRTDPGGVIKFGNSVFQRVAGYAWDDLKDKPHKIIRHPDMPRAVFEKLWRTIKAGAPVGAYVKNRARDGAYYWVFAVVTPVAEGYMSVRLKPVSPLLKAVQGLYAQFEGAERAEKLSPGESLERVEAALGGLGFPDYSAFMATALGTEILARDEALGHRPDPAIRLYLDLAEAVRGVLADAGTIVEAYDASEHMPLNFQVQAAHLGAAGAAVGEISENYKLITAQITESMRRFVDGASAVRAAIFDGLFLEGAARLQDEMLRQFAAEQGEGDTSGESDLLACQRDEYLERAVRGLQVVRRSVAAFRAECAEMSRLSSGLEVTRIMGMVECARLDAEGASLRGLLEELGVLQRTLSEGLKSLERRNATIRDTARSLLAVA